MEIKFFPYEDGEIIFLCQDEENVSKSSSGGKLIRILLNKSHLLLHFQFYFPRLVVALAILFFISLTSFIQFMQPVRCNQWKIIASNIFQSTAFSCSHNCSL